MSETPADTATLNSGASSSRIDIRHAEAEFVRLQRELSSPDHKDSAARARSPTLKSERLPKDIEKDADADVDAEERFDLREYLTSSNDATQAAGIKHKHVGVTWDDLEVIGYGGEDNKANPPFYRCFIFPRLTPPPDICPHVPRRDYGDAHVPLNANHAFRIPPPPLQVDPYPPYSFDYP